MKDSIENINTNIVEETIQTVLREGNKEGFKIKGYKNAKFLAEEYAKLQGFSLNEEEKRICADLIVEGFKS